ncbi:DUF5131 family protein [Propionibacterium australiense]|uniref:DUF5131 family protein n=1 Tax=Propionibacterium australiense TaxID=119981 RepID=A0A8B3FT54_9ACTN|nr:DUF5131 family protein [Propionibacterium australiense]RLP10715.1 DUF5131 family protein [Propionibacterium australiense]
MADPRSWNPWHGCAKYSTGCKNCYMFALDAARKVPERSSVIARTASTGLPLARNRRGDFKIPPGYCLRVNMTSDTFLEEADPWRDEMWDIIRRRPDVVFYVLTKRVDRIMDHLPADWGDGYENVDLNISCENQRVFDMRWPLFEKVPARHKGFNLAPLLGPIDIAPALASGQIENVFAGGESFGGTRPCNHAWVKQISDDCRRYGVNFTFNSTGSVFVMDGKRYRIRKAIQAEQAYKSGLSHADHETEYVLYDPVDGHRLAKEELCPRVFNADKCMTCPNLHSCRGCILCTNCKGARRVGLDEILSLRERRPGTREE